MGRVLSATAYYSTAGFGRVGTTARCTWRKPETGMNLPTRLAKVIDAALVEGRSATITTAAGLAEALRGA